MGKYKEYLIEFEDGSKMLEYANNEEDAIILAKAYRIKAGKCKKIKSIKDGTNIITSSR